MKKTFKLVGIFAGVLLVVVVGAIAGFVLVEKNKTYYIYDLRIVEPVKESTGYIYRDTERSYKHMKNKKVYMTSEEENFLEIAVYSNMSINDPEIKIESSNNNVAKIIYKDNKCYVNYVGAGKATITTSHADVTDSFDIYVYDQISSSFNVFDYKYYGEFASYFPNHIIGYSDSISYGYDYLAYSSFGESADDELNNNLLRIDESQLNKDVFESVSIDAVNKRLMVKCKSGITKNVDEQIAIQSYTYTGEGKESVLNNYVVNVHVVAYTPEFLQMVVSKSPNFEDKMVYMNTKIIDDSNLTEENILNDASILDRYLSYKKAENNLVRTGEKPTYDLYFTDKIDTLYVKFRKVYTNGDIVYLDDFNKDVAFTLGADTNYLKVQPMRNYYKLVVSKDYFDANGTFDINIDLLDYDLDFEFVINYAELSAANVEKFYDIDATTGVYTYKYWDPRTRYDNEIYDESGNIIAIAGI